MSEQRAAMVASIMQGLIIADAIEYQSARSRNMPLVMPDSSNRAERAWDMVAAVESEYAKRRMRE